MSRLNREERVAVLLAEQNATIALRFAQYGYVMENGRIVLDGDAKTISRERGHQGVLPGPLRASASARATATSKHYKRRKRWLS
mgnify:CR=1 FL=1